MGRFTHQKGMTESDEKQTPTGRQILCNKPRLYLSNTSVGRSLEIYGFIAFAKRTSMNIIMSTEMPSKDPLETWALLHHPLAWIRQS